MTKLGAKDSLAYEYQKKPPSNKIMVGIFNISCPTNFQKKLGSLCVDIQAPFSLFSFFHALTLSTHLDNVKTGLGLL